MVGKSLGILAMGLAVGLLAGFVSLHQAAAADVTLRISCAAPPSDFLAKSLETFKASIASAKVGVVAEAYPASSLFRQGTEVPALQRGNLEMSTMTTFEVAQQLPEWGLFNRAYLFRDYPHMRHVFDGPIGAEYRKAVSGKMGIEILATAYLGTRQVNLRQKRDVKTPADLGGVKMRMPAGPEWLVLGRTLGVSPVPLGMPEVYLALKTGTIDGQENPLSILNAAKLYEVTQQVVLTSHLVQPVFFAIAKPFWEKLSPDQKKAVSEAAVTAARENDEGRLKDEAEIVNALKAKGLSVDALDLAPFRALADKSYDGSYLAKDWNAGLLKRVVETK
jgi:tripartite ATP-independent transporter DctP family solute receptor